MTRTPSRRTERDHQIDTALVIALATLSATTSAIHYQIGGLSSLMGMMFWANAVGFAGLAAALVAPIAIARRYRFLVQIAMVGFAAATAGGWLLFGARYDMGYLSFAIEVAMVGLGLAAAYRERESIVAFVNTIKSLVRRPRPVA